MQQWPRRRGKPLSDEMRSFFEPRFGTGFDDVRVHTGGAADKMARSVNAEAFTTGSDVVFRAGAYRPETRAGRRLIAHELTHVVQQRGDGAAERSTLQRQAAETDDREEEERQSSRTDESGGYCTPERHTPNMNSYRLYDFDVEEAALKPGHKACLREMVLPEIKRTENVAVGLVGHASTTGSQEVNKPLSRRRAEAVHQWLLDNGVSEDQLRMPTGVGERRPLDPTTPHDPGVERAEDRAVRIQIWSIQRETEVPPCEVTEAQWDRLFEYSFNYCEGEMLSKGLFDAICSGLSGTVCVLAWVASPVSEDARKLRDTCCSISQTPPDALAEEMDDCVITESRKQIRQQLEIDCSEAEVREAYRAWKKRRAREERQRAGEPSEQ